MRLSEEATKRRVVGTIGTDPCRELEAAWFSKSYRGARGAAIFIDD
jgi:hypothetical protein